MRTSPHSFLELLLDLVAVDHRLTPVHHHSIRILEIPLAHRTLLVFHLVSHLIKARRLLQQRPREHLQRVIKSLAQTPIEQLELFLFLTFTTKVARQLRATAPPTEVKYSSGVNGFAT